LEVYVAPNFVPLYAGIPDEEQARRMVGALENTGFGLSDESLTPVPSYDRYGFAFFPTRYFVSLCKDQGFYEYYDPTTGFGHGSDLFSWTAALFLDVVLED
jgi:hypothetical protein